MSVNYSQIQLSCSFDLVWNKTLAVQQICCSFWRVVNLLYVSTWPSKVWSLHLALRILQTIIQTAIIQVKKTSSRSNTCTVSVCQSINQSCCIVNSMPLHTFITHIVPAHNNYKLLIFVSLLWNYSRMDTHTAVRVIRGFHEEWQSSPKSFRFCVKGWSVGGYYVVVVITIRSEPNRCDLVSPYTLHSRCICTCWKWQNKWFRYSMK